MKLLAGMDEAYIHKGSPSKPHTRSNNKSLDLCETIVVGEMATKNTNTVYQMQRQLFARSERVKGIDFHPVEPWILTTLYSGMLNGA
jgi:coatomer subunit beta'